MPFPDPSPSYTWNAADYHKSSQVQQQWVKELIAKLGLSGTSQVLDIGCVCVEIVYLSSLSLSVAATVPIR